MAKLSFKNVLENAKQSKEQDEASRGGTPHLYPGKGITQFRLLYNPKADAITREIHRHWSEELGQHVPCLKGLYGADCPLCKVADEYKDHTGKDPDWSMYAQTKSIAYIVFDSAENPASDKGPKKGELSILVAAKTVGKQINNLFADPDVADNVESFLGENSAFNIKVSRVDGNRVEYSVSANTFKKLPSFASEEEFHKVMDNLPDLRETIYPSKPTKDMFDKAREAANKLRATLGMKVDETSGDDQPPTP